MSAVIGTATPLLCRGGGRFGRRSRRTFPSCRSGVGRCLSRFLGRFWISLSRPIHSPRWTFPNRFLYRLSISRKTHRRCNFSIGLCPHACLCQINLRRRFRFSICMYRCLKICHRRSGLSTYLRLSVSRAHSHAWVHFLLVLRNTVHLCWGR